MLADIPQFVPQKVCLSCDGCCRFKDQNSEWRPHLSMDDVYYARQSQPSLAEKIFNKDNVDRKGYLKTKNQLGQCECHFFDSKTNECGIYSQRPFECQFYPFLLTQTKVGGVDVSVHLSCPHILDTRNDEHFEMFVEKLRLYFSKPDVLNFVKNNRSLAGVYAGYEDEIESLFSLPLAQADSIVTLMNQRMTIERSLLDEKNISSNQSFVPIFAWSPFYDYDIQLIDSAVCVFAKHEDSCFMPMPPMGQSITEGLVEKCFSIMNDVNPLTARIENVTCNNIDDFSEKEFRIEKKGYEYIYHKNDLVLLEGMAYKSKRHDKNRFLKDNSYQYLPYSSSMFDQCLELYSKWQLDRGKNNMGDLYSHMMDENQDVHKHVIANYEQLGLIGRVLTVDEKVVGYTFGYPVHPKVFCVLFEITDSVYTGSAVTLFHHLCSDDILKSYSFINVMDDCGLPNMERVKKSFNPKILWPLYTVRML